MGLDILWISILNLFITYLNLFNLFVGHFSRLDNITIVCALAYLYPKKYAFKGKIGSFFALIHVW